MIVDEIWQYIKSKINGLETEFFIIANAKDGTIINKKRAFSIKTFINIREYFEKYSTDFRDVDVEMTLNIDQLKLLNNIEIMPIPILE